MYLTLDLETGSKESYLRKGNPFDPKNKIVAIGIKNQGAPEAGSYYLLDCPWASLDDWVSDLILGDVIVGFNIKFDLLYLWRSKVFQEWLKKGGRIFDCQLAEYTLTGQRHKYPPLRDKFKNGKLSNPGVARKYGCKDRRKCIDDLLFSRTSEGLRDLGLTLEQHDNRILSEYPEITNEQLLSFKDMYDIPRELVLEDVRNDVLDTEQIMLRQAKLLKEAGMWDLTQSLMDSVLATTEMEFNGIFINQEVFQENKCKILSQIDSIKQELEILTREYQK